MTTTETSSKYVDEVIKRLEEDAMNMLKFMASNGLFANPNKTSVVLLNAENNSKIPIQVKIGKEIVTQERTAKLLGIIKS